MGIILYNKFKFIDIILFNLTVAEFNRLLFVKKGLEFALL